MIKQHNYYVYIMASESRVVYIGVTSDLEKRVQEHKLGVLQGFTRKYHCKRLVYYEYFEDINYAIAREKQLKKWRRSKKVDLIERMNSEWKDLSLNWDRIT